MKDLFKNTPLLD